MHHMVGDMEKRGSPLLPCPGGSAISRGDCNYRASSCSPWISWRTCSSRDHPTSRSIPAYNRDHKNQHIDRLVIAGALLESVVRGGCAYSSRGIYCHSSPTGNASSTLKCSHIEQDLNKRDGMKSLLKEPPFEQTARRCFGAVHIASSISHSTIINNSWRTCRTPY